jgi:hypothetical protein
MCNVPREVRAALFGVRQEAACDVPEDEKSVGADEPVRHPVLHE